MQVDNIGQLVEYADGRLDLQYWVFDCDCCATINEAIVKHRDELVRLAKEAGTYLKVG